MTRDASVFEATSDEAGDPIGALRSCIESGSRTMLLHRAALSESFFDLRTGIAGELTQKAVVYGVRLAAIVPDLESRIRFRELALEANRGDSFRIFADREDAIAWLLACPSLRTGE